MILNACFEVIYIKSFGGYDLEKLEFVGRGMHGNVYRIDLIRCLKIFKKKTPWKNELRTLKMGQNDKHFPELFSWGEGYIIREFIDGIELDKYLLDNPLDFSMSKKVMELYDAMIKVGFSRCDTALLHIFVTKNRDLKLIDTARAMKGSRRYPEMIIRDFKRLGCLETFFHHLSVIRPELYDEWNKKLKNRSQV